MSHSTSPIPTTRDRRRMTADCHRLQGRLKRRPWRLSCRLPCRLAGSALAVAPVALAGLGLRLGVLPPVGGERTADVVALLELSLRAAPHEPLVRAGVDQLPPAGTLALCGHCVGPPSLGNPLQTACHNTSRHGNVTMEKL